MPVFLDSNIVLYALGDDDAKKSPALALLAAMPCISTQVVNECSHVLRRRLNWQTAQIAEELLSILQLVQLQQVDMQTIQQAWIIAARYGFSHYDSLIIASSLISHCEILYSEDLQHGQVIQNRLTVINPFRKTA